MEKEKEVSRTTASEQSSDTGSSSPDGTNERQVPLAALEAERSKRQEWEAQNRALQDYANSLKAQVEQLQQKAAPDDSGEDLVNKRDLKQFRETLSKEELAKMKREIAEDTFKEANPEAIKKINAHLNEILERKPWLAASIEQSTNRYSRAFEIVQDYMPAMAAKNNAAEDAKRIVENAKKPGSPTTVGKSANLSGSDSLLGMRGKKEFREYRTKLLQG